MHVEMMQLWVASFITIASLSCLASKREEYTSRVIASAVIGGIVCVMYWLVDLIGGAFV